MKNNKEKQTSYKDFKYVYTGYKDYCKDHDIKIINPNTNKQKEEINHDHNYTFDFNNPNQHKHDYSFDFSQKDTKTSTKQNTSKTNQSQTYNRPTYNTFNNNSSSNYQQDSTNVTINKEEISKQSKKVLAGIIVFIVLVNIIPVVGVFFSAYNDLDQDYEYKEEYYEDSYANAVEDYCNAIEYLDYTYLEKRITEQELDYNDGQLWKNDISNTKTKINSNVVTSFDYEYFSTNQINSYNLNRLQNNFNSKYSSNITIDDAYDIMLKLTINDKITYKIITTAKIDNTWYLLSVG